MKVNLLAIVGGLLAVTCVLLPWTVTTTTSVFGESVRNDAMTDFVHEEDAAFALAVVLFLLGSALAAATPLAGVGLFFGWLIFLASAYERLGTTETAIADITVSLGIGFFVGLVAAGIVLFSLARPWGPGYLGRGVEPQDRLFIWSG